MTWNSRPSMKTPVPGEGSQTALIQEAIETLEEVVEEDDGDTVFLWTGGKEAQVIADLLLYEVGPQEGVSPVPFGVIDTGNQFDEMYRFRRDFAEASGDQGADTVGPFNGIGNRIIIEKYEEFLDNIIRNEYDPRGYHGEHTGDWKCPACGEVAELNEREKRVECGECGTNTKLKPVQRQNLKPGEWGVPESCGALKV
ncbi:MAG: phosphoadenosine phosphosulfate reductase family protein, partial [Candidatus Nanohaloarchaea archaeon]